MFAKLTKTFKLLTVIFKKKTNGLIFLLCIILSLALFAIPFIVRERSESINATLSVSFSAVSTVLTAATFVIAYLLYEKLSLDRRIMDKQADVVLQLVDFLKGKTFIAKSDGYAYFIRPAIHQLDDSITLPKYSINSEKVLVINSENYDIFFGALTPLMRSYWMPAEIKEKLNFLEFRLYRKSNSIERSELSERYINFAFGHGVKEFDSLLVLPETTMASFISDLKSLVQTIEQWIQERSSIPVELRLWEPI